MRKGSALRHLCGRREHSASALFLPRLCFSCNCNSIASYNKRSLHIASKQPNSLPAPKSSRNLGTALMCRVMACISESVSVFLLLKTCIPLYTSLAPRSKFIKAKQSTSVTASFVSKPKLEASKLLCRKSEASEEPEDWWTNYGVETKALKDVAIRIVSQPCSASGSPTDSAFQAQTWLPSPPLVERPRAVYNATTLAYLGDCIYELYARRHFLFPPLSINEYNRRVMALVCCEAQNTLLKALLKENFLTEEERDIVRWGRNIESGKTKTTRRAGSAVYNRASSLETLVGYLYLTNVDRLDAVMKKLGFCVDSRMNDFNGLNVTDFST